MASDRERTDRPVAVIAWAPSDIRPRALADALGGEARTFFDLGIVWRPLVPLRYLISAARTAAYLARRRPGSVVIQAPPVPAVLIAWAYACVARARVVIDSHPASFGLEGVRVDGAMLPLLRWLARRAEGCIVTTGDLARRVEEWGGRPLIVHEPPLRWTVANGASDRPTALFVCTFSPNEPLVEVLEAARQLPDVHFQVTGDLRRRPQGLERTAPPNVEWVGYLHGDDYRRALGAASVILSLTRRTQDVPRSAYEAVYALRPLVVTNWPHMTDLFPHAVQADNDADRIAAAVRDALARLDELTSAATAARSAAVERCTEQIDALRVAVQPRELVAEGGAAP